MELGKDSEMRCGVIAEVFYPFLDSDDVTRRTILSPTVNPFSLRLPFVPTKQPYGHLKADIDVATIQRRLSLEHSIPRMNKRIDHVVDLKEASTIAEVANNDAETR